MKNKDILFSIIIPVYNVELYLRQCLDSIVNQTYTNYEVICVNDMSTDGSYEILKEYENKNDKFKILNQETKALIAGARNLGLKSAKGEYIVFIDSDDWIQTNMLEVINNSLSNQDILAFKAQLYFENKQTILLPSNEIVEEFDSGVDYSNKYILQKNDIHFSCIWQRVYKRDFLVSNNFFFKEGTWHEDNLFTYIVCYSAKSIKIIQEYLYMYRIREGSFMRSVDVKKMFDVVVVANTAASFFIPKTDIPKTQIYREIAGLYFNGFSNDNLKIYGNKDKKLKKVIDWKSYKTVSIYPRHKLIYILIKIHPRLFRLFLKLEKYIKRFF